MTGKPLAKNPVRRAPQRVASAAAGARRCGTAAAFSMTIRMSWHCIAGLLCRPRVDRAGPAPLGRLTGRARGGGGGRRGGGGGARPPRPPPPPCPRQRGGGGGGGGGGGAPPRRSRPATVCCPRGRSRRRGRPRRRA